MNHTRVLNTVVAALVLWAVALHGLFFVSAGALWRDEANSVAQATLPSWRAVGESLQYDSFPLLYPALLRVWSLAVPSGSDIGLRLFGLIAGFGFVISLLAAARVAGFSRPLAAIVLVAASPLFITEADSLRPYGTGFVCLAWSCAFYAKSLTKHSPGWIAAAALSCTLAVQASYANAAMVAVLALCAALVALRTTKMAAWKLLAPACVAALSLAPYAGVLRRAADWSVLVRQSVDWPAFAARFLDIKSAFFAAAWLAFGAFALAGIRRMPKNERRDVPRVYFAALAAAALPAQLVMLELLGVPPFPRYFLPALILVALSIDALTPAAVSRALFALAAALLLAVPTWTALCRRRTNADDAGAMVSAAAAPRDLVLISPWFLHPGFQRYYHGSAPWLTVPEMPAAPIMRYDLVKRAMLDDGSAERIFERTRSAVASGGVVWLVTQRVSHSTPLAWTPRRPEVPSTPGGVDYVRFRSYWEDGLKHVLESCCTALVLPAADGRAVWDEEDLVVLRWSAER